MPVRAIGALLVWAALLVPAIGGAQANFPPLARASADPLEVLAGEVVAFSSAGSQDPDDGPSPLTFAWDFGDGSGSNEASPRHVFDAPGFYPATLTIDDGQATAVAQVSVAVLVAPTAVASARSDRVALSADGSDLWVVNPDSASVTRVDTLTLTTTEHPTCEAPQSVALSADGQRVFVSCREAGSLCVLDATTPGDCDLVAVGRRPRGVAVSPADGAVWVACEGDGTIARLSADGSAVTDRVPLGGTPRALAIMGDGSRVYVTHFLTRGDSATVSALAPADLSVTTIALALDPGPDTATSGRGYPNQLSTAAISPDGRRLWVGGLKSNTDRGLHLDSRPLVPVNRVRGLFAPIDTGVGEELLPRRIDTNDADSVSGAAFSPRGRYAYLLHQGIARLSVYDLSAAVLHDSSDGDTVPFEARVDLGHAPQGIVLSADGSRAYVMAYLERALQVVDVSDPKAPAVLDTVALTDEPLAETVSRGKRVFFRSREPELSEQGYIACASCHPEGGHDGRTWDFTQVGEGLRNTIDLRGRAGMSHGPVHWSANFDEIQDFENDIVGGFGGTGLVMDGMAAHPPLDAMRNAGRGEQLDALALYVSSLASFPASPHRQPDGSMGEAALRGRAIFFEAQRLCVECHLPPRFTDSVLTADPADFVRHDVGTLGPGSGGHLGGELEGIDTPTLRGVWDGAPYFHDGSAATLHEVLGPRNATDQHGVTSDLGAAQLDDLVAYLLTLDDGDAAILPGWTAPTEPPPSADGGAGAGAGAD
ncbi:MAG: PKD domain-containing protein, partial [Myxococcales bacterium]|nr:PKD domain-containing protein [Myxococcales bacterium]